MKYLSYIAITLVLLLTGFVWYRYATSSAYIGNFRGSEYRQYASIYFMITWLPAILLSLSLRSFRHDDSIRMRILRIAMTLLIGLIWFITFSVTYDKFDIH